MCLGDNPREYLVRMSFVLPLFPRVSLVKVSLYCMYVVEVFGRSYVDCFDKEVNESFRDSFYIGMYIGEVYVVGLHMVHTRV